MSGLNEKIQHQFMHTFALRYAIWFIAISLFIFTSVIHLFYSTTYLPYFLSRELFNLLWVITGALSALGLYDILQNKHAILKNYPITGHFRYLFENIRPEIRQYFVESDQDASPFSRMQRSLVYQRAKNENADKPFGSILDTYAENYRFMVHSMRPKAAVDPSHFRIQIGNSQCLQPYIASIFNISAMSFGSLSANAIRALNQGAQMGQFFHDTGEGSISPYHLEYGGDLVWELGSGYFGCRTLDGQFDPVKFAQQSQLPQVKMIEVKLSQGAKPGHGGILPKNKISDEIAAIRGIRKDIDCVSPAYHSAFNTPLEFVHFLQTLRELSKGKPIGFKLCLGQPWQFMSMIKAMLHTGIVPDFIVVDGSEGGTGASPIELIDHVGTPLREGLRFVHNSLVGAGLRDQIKLGASGKIISAFDIADMMAMGADWVNSARGFMFAIGCIQAQSCHTNQCPVGIATQDAKRQSALHVPTKAQRVYHFHKNTLKALSELLASAGLEHPCELESHHLALRINDREIKNYAQIYFWLKPNELMQQQVYDEDNFYHRMWALADMNHF